MQEKKGLIHREILFMNFAPKPTNKIDVSVCVFVGG